MITTNQSADHAEALIMTDSGQIKTEATYA
jgi:hypothetical protein